MEKCSCLTWLSATNYKLQIGLIKMETQKYSSYALTVRPRDGLTDSQLHKTVDWITKRSTYYHVVTEKLDSERHLHAALFLKTPVTRSNLWVVLRRLGDDLDLDSDELKVLSGGLKIMWNSDWYSNYLDKDDATYVVKTNLPEQHHLESYFPPKPVEAVPESVRKHMGYYAKLEVLWYEHMDPGLEKNTRNARDFLFKMMYSLRLIPVLRDDKTIVQTARHLVRFINKAEESTIELPCYEKEE